MKLKDYILQVWINATPQDRQDRHDRHDLFDWLVRHKIVERNEWVRCVDIDGIVHIDEAFLCEHTEDFYANDSGFSAVITRRGCEEQWCESAREDDAFYCDWSEHYFANRYYEQVEVDGRQYVCREWNEDNLYFWDSDEEWHSEPEPEEEDEDEDSVQDNGRSGYHSDMETRRRWARASYNTDVFGVELEMKANDESSLQDICARAAGAGFLTEYDGSLDERLGVEVVAPPTPLAKFRKGAWSEFLTGIRRLGIGWDAGQGYGIHISITRSSLTKLQQAKFLRFFADNQQFCEVIAGRSETNWARYRRVGWKESCTEFETEKYLAASIRPKNRIEVRIFRSTLKFDSFLKNVQFVAALVEFVRQSSVARNSRFELVKFLSHKSRRNRFRELLAFLADKNLNGTAPESVS